MSPRSMALPRGHLCLPGLSIAVLYVMAVASTDGAKEIIFAVIAGTNVTFDCGQYVGGASGQHSSVDWFKYPNLEADHRAGPVEGVYIYEWRPGRAAKIDANIQIEGRLAVTNHLKLTIHNTVTGDTGSYECSVGLSGLKPFNMYFLLNVTKASVVGEVHVHTTTTSTTSLPVDTITTTTNYQSLPWLIGIVSAASLLIILVIIYSVMTQIQGRRRWQRGTDEEMVAFNTTITQPDAKYEFEITGPVKGFCVTTKKGIKLSEVVTGSNVKIHSCFEGAPQTSHTIPTECYTECSTRIHDDIVIADSVNKRLLVIDHDGNVIKNIPVFVNPWYICSVGETVWINSRGSVKANMHMFRMKFGKDYTILEQESIVLECPYTDAYNISANERRIAVSHTYADRVCVHDWTGKFLFSYGKQNGHLSHPHGVCLDAADNLYIADHNNGRIVIVNPSGKLINVIYIDDRPNRLALSGSKLYIECRGQFVYEYDLCRFLDS